MEIVELFKHSHSCALFVFPESVSLDEQRPLLSYFFFFFLPPAASFFLFSRFALDLRIEALLYVLPPRGKPALTYTHCESGHERKPRIRIPEAAWQLMANGLETI